MEVEGTRVPGRGPQDKVVFEDEHIEVVRRIGRFLNKTQLAEVFGMSPRTFSRLCERQPRVKRAWKQAKAQTVAQVAQKLLDRALDGHVTAGIFWMKSQGKWIDDHSKTTVEVSGPGGGPIQHMDVVEARKQVLRELTRKGKASEVPDRLKDVAAADVVGDDD